MDDVTVFAASPMPATLIDTEGLIADVNEIFLEWARSMGRDLRKEDRIGHHVAEFSSVFEEREQVVVSSTRSSENSAASSCDGRAGRKTATSSGEISGDR
ncbi:MAG: hypothetical protein CME05_13045 [Gemmatimonadaceae bacterium]|nr:hypothetical protein [Gemmatimonadaceae bacterium]